MKDILNEIVAHKRIEIEAAQKRVSANELSQQIESQAVLQECSEQPIMYRSLKKALTHSRYGLLAEFKRKSPSKGWINKEALPEVIPAAYEQNGAAACSILTDETYFGGNLGFLQQSRQQVSIPLLRKDFIVDAYQLLEAKLYGADAVLLIAAALSINECKLLSQKANALGLETLLEIHQESELDYINEYTDVVGVNNRNLGTFITDVQNSFHLVDKIPNEFAKISESGISTPQTVQQLRQAGFNGFLIGECFMKTADPGQSLHRFIHQLDSLNV